MKSNKKIGQLAGLLFLLALIPYVIGQMAILERLLYLPDYLDQIRSKRELVGVAVILKWIGITAMIGFTVLVFPILRKFGNELALGYLGLRFIEFGMLIMGSTKLMSLVSLSKNLVDNETSEYALGEFLANSILIEWEWIGFIYMYAFVLHCFLFYYLLLRSSLIPRFISIAGLLASGSVLINVIFGVLGLNIGGFYLFAPIGLIELTLGIWLIAFGFKDKNSILN